MATKIPGLDEYLGFTVSPATKARLVQLAAAEQTSISALARRILVTGLAAQTSQSTEVQHAA